MPRSCTFLLSRPYVNFLSASLFDVIKPFSTRSSSPRFSFHHYKHHLPPSPAFILHMCPNKSSFLSMICCMMFFLQRILLLTSSFVIFCSHLILNILHFKN